MHGQVKPRRYQVRACKPNRHNSLTNRSGKRKIEGQSLEGGDLDSTEIWFRRMRAEDHPPRKSDGKKPNCGHAARTRSLNPCERPFRSACGPETDVILAGWRLPVAPDGSGETSLELAPGGSGRGFTSGARFQTRIRIVDSCVDIFSDPGANPGASTIRLAALRAARSWQAASGAASRMVS